MKPRAVFDCMVFLLERDPKDEPYIDLALAA